MGLGWALALGWSVFFPNLSETLFVSLASFMASIVPHIASNEVVARFFVLSLDRSFMPSLENASDTVCKWKYDKSKLTH